MKRIFLFAILGICMFCTGCGRYENENKEILMEKFDSADMSKIKAEVYNVSFLRFDMVKFMGLAGVNMAGDGSEKFVVSEKRNNYYCSNTGFDLTDCTEKTECADIPVKKCIEKYIDLLEAGGIEHLSDKYEPLTVNSERGIYYVKLSQEIDGIEVSNITHGDIYKMNRIEGTSVEIYFTLDELQLLAVGNCLKINKDSGKPENLCDKKDIAGKLMGTYGKIAGDYQFSVEEAVLKYTVLQYKPDKYMIIPTWLLKLKVIFPEDTDYEFPVIFNAINAKEIL